MSNKRDLDYALKIAQKTAYLMFLQEEVGITFDKEGAIAIAEQIQAEMQEIEARIEPLLPEVPMNKGELQKEKVPVRRFKMDKKETHGLSVSADMIGKYGSESFYKDTTEHWCFKPLECKVKDIPDEYYMKTTRPFKLKDQMDLKQYLMDEHDWQPTLWNYKKDAKGKDIRDPVTKQKIETTPKFHDKGDLCENLVILGETVDWLADIVRWLSIKHKHSLLIGGEAGDKGLCNHPRLDIDGRLPAGSYGITNTWRQRHNVVVNMPRAGSVYGNEIRGLFKASEGMVAVGYDASSLEDYIKGHYCSYFDGGEYALKIADPNYDPHRENGMAWGLMKDENDKAGRQKTKGGTYCVPEYSDVLTIDGWKPIKDVCVGDTVIGYSEVTGLQQATLVRDAIRIEDTPVVRLSVKNRLTLDCTENHRWIGDKVNFKGEYLPCSFETKDIVNAHRIRNTAKSNIGKLRLDLEKAELIGWLLAEGSIKFSGFTRNTIQGGHFSICQKGGELCDRIEYLIDSQGMTYAKYSKEESGVYVFKLHATPFRAFWCELFGQTNKHDADWCKFVLSLDYDSLEALFKGFYLGDGGMTIPRGEFRFNKFSQIKGKINEGMQLAAHLLGYRVAYRDIKSKGKPIEVTSIGNNPFVTCQRINKSELGNMDVYCLTTDLGSFVMRQNNCITITGNCLQYNAMPPTLARTIGVSLEDAKRFHEIYWDINWAWREVNTRLEKQWESRNKKGVLCPVSGAFLYITSKNILGSWTVQHTGSFAMDLAGCIMDEWLGGITRDEKGLPCYYYKGKKAVRILYMHDEYLWECDPEIADDILSMGIESITEAGRRLELKVELSADGSVGNTWADVH